MEGEIAPSFNIEAVRQARRVEPFVTDYLPDDKKLNYPDRVKYYRMLKTELGVASVRSEFRMKHMLNRDGSFNEETLKVYGDSLRAMREAGLGDPNLVLFTPAKWMNKLAETNPDQFVVLFKTYAAKVAQMCKEASVTPARVQVMNEVNAKFQTKINSETLVRLIQETAGLFRPDFPTTKIITTIATAPAKNWQSFTKELLKGAGESLDGVGFDYYPGSYEYPAGVPLVGKEPFEAFGGTTPYSWIAAEKSRGMLRDKDVVLAEIGAPALTQESKFQRFGYDRIFQSLDHFFLEGERQGVPAHEMISAVGFFLGGDQPAADTKEPRAVGLTRWALLRQDPQGEWQPTNAGRRLKDLIHTRLNPTL